MAYSRTDLATRALRKANLIGSEEVPSAADLEFVSEGIASDTAALAVDGVVMENGNDQSVPLEHLEPRSQYHAVTLKADYGMISDVQAEQAKSLMLPRLRRLCAKPATGATAQNDYF
jgi:hypothetical protein